MDTQVYVIHIFLLAPAGSTRYVLATRYATYLNRRFRNFSFYPSIAPTGLIRAEDSLETETRFKEESRKTVRKKEKIGERKKEQEAN